jgi:hypothetical protein
MIIPFSAPFLCRYRTENFYALELDQMKLEEKKRESLRSKKIIKEK